MRQFTEDSLSISIRPPMNPTYLQTGCDASYGVLESRTIVRLAVVKDLGEGDDNEFTNVKIPRPRGCSRRVKRIVVSPSFYIIEVQLSHFIAGEPK